MSDKNNNVMMNNDMNNNMNNDNDPKERMRKKVKKAAGIALCAVLAGGLAAGSFEGINTLTGWNSSTVEAASNKENTTLLQTKSKKKSSDKKSDDKEKSKDDSESKTKGSLDVSDIAAEGMKSVVSITTKSVQDVQNYLGYYGFGGSQGYTTQQEVEGSGSGIIIGKNDTELLIVTNNHVVEDADTLSVSFVNNQVCKANIKGTDADNDLAVIAVPLSEIPDDTMSSIAVATMGDSDSVEVGEQVVAIGNALGYGQSVTTGIISAANRVIDSDSSSDGSSDGTTADTSSTDTTGKTYLQTDAAINPGNSGGALLNMNGEVIGINSAKLASTEVEGMGYAIPVSRVSDIIENLMNEQTRTKVAAEDQGTIGIKCLDVSSQIQQAYNMPAGIYISEVTSGGAAENAGLKSGYVLTSFDGHSITSTSELKSLLQYYSAGETVEVEVQVPDNGSYETKTFSLTLGTSISSSDDQQSDSQQNAGSSRSAEGGNTLTSATPSI